MEHRVKWYRMRDMTSGDFQGMKQDKASAKLPARCNPGYCYHAGIAMQG